MNSPFTSESSRTWTPLQLEFEDRNQTFISVKSKRYFLNSDLRSRRGQQIQLAKIVFTTLIPILLLFAETTYRLVNSYRELAKVNKIRTEILFSLETGNMVHYLQIERGTTALFIGSNGSSEVYQNLQEKYALTNNVIAGLSKWQPSSDPEHFQSRNAFVEHIIDFRNNLVPWQMQVTVDDVINFYTADNAVIIGWVADSVKFSESGDTWQTLVAYHMLMLSKEQAGIERALGGVFFAKGNFTNQELVWYGEKKTLGESYLDISQKYSTSVKTLLSQSFFGSSLSERLNQMRESILDNNSTGPSVSAGIRWFENMTDYINILKDVSDGIGTDIVNLLDAELDTIRDQVIISVAIMCVAVLLFPLVLFLVVKLTKQLQVFANDLKSKTKSLDIERKRSETLLYQMLPVPVARKLMQKKTVSPEQFSKVTIYFSDIVGFTTICSRSSPLEVVNMLGLVYQNYDSILDKYDVYKVETIGDAYMVASGLPQRNGKNHVAEISCFALEILETIRTLKIPHLEDEVLRIRTGINSGSVVAGVVGHTMPRYCLFGDTVNVASRMESSSEPLKIQISDSSKSALGHFSGFITEERGLIDVKGKGQMLTHWLLGTESGFKYEPKVENRKSFISVNAFF